MVARRTITFMISRRSLLGSTIAAGALAPFAAEAQGRRETLLSNIVSSARRMSALIKDLQTYTLAAKAEEGPVPAVDADAVLADVLKALRAQIEESHAEVTSGGLPAVSIHESRLAMIFQNLISNAIKYRGSEPPRVRVTAERRDDFCVFSISDNGIGIDPNHVEQIFGLFKRLHARETYPGSGLGLAICQRVAEQYRGRIWVEESAPGKGSTFCFAIPGCKE